MLVLNGCQQPSEPTADSSVVQDATLPRDSGSILDAGAFRDSSVNESACSDGGSFDHVYLYDHTVPDTPERDAIYHPDRVHYDASFDAWCAPPRRFTGCDELFTRFSATAIAFSDTYRGCGTVDDCTFTTVSIQCDYGGVTLCPMAVSVTEEQSYQQDLAISSRTICGCMAPVDSGAVCVLTSCMEQTLFCENNLCGAR